MKKYAVIVAGGSGSRMGTALPKQFLELCGRPVLWYTLNTFLAAYEDMPIVLVVPAAHHPMAQALVETTADPARVQLVAGGATRFESVRNGLAVVGSAGSAGSVGLAGPAGDSVIFVHDGVRCLVRTALIHRCYEAALNYGSAIPVIDSRDSVRLVTSFGNEAIDRHHVKLVQTPQTFLASILIPAFTADFRESFTDEASVVETAGHPIHLVEGEVDNIKITVPADLAIAERVLSL